MRIAIVVAFRNFRDEEYFIPKQVFENVGAKIIVFSTSVGTAIGVHGGETQVQKTLEEYNPKDFDAVIFVGGSGARELMENSSAHRIAQETVDAGKIVGAICIAPTILAKAGVLTTKKATVWSSPLDKSAVTILKEGGALYKKAGVVIDGKIITAEGPSFAEEFAESLLKLLTAGF